MNGIAGTTSTFDMNQLFGLGGMSQAGFGSPADVQDSVGNSLNTLRNKIKIAQDKGIDRASTVLDLLHEMKSSDNPAIARIGKELCQVDDRIGGRFSGSKQEYLLNQAMALVNAQIGGAAAANHKPQGNAWDY